MIAASVMNSVRAIGRHVHDEDVADAARGAQAGVAVDMAALHQFVGVQAALHQRLDLARAHQRDGRLPPRRGCARSTRSRTARGRYAPPPLRGGFSPRDRREPPRSARRARLDGADEEGESVGWTTAVRSGAKPRVISTTGDNGGLSCELRHPGRGRDGGEIFSGGATASTTPLKVSSPR